jgi:hypothetical protein
MKEFILPLLIFLVLLSNINSTICKDGSYCPGYSTCCLTPHGVGCCPYQNAVCCGDGRICCPYGYVCGYQTCYRQSLYADFLEKEYKPEEIIVIDKINKLTENLKTSLELEIEYVKNYCISDKKIDISFMNMIRNCKDKEYSLVDSQNCKFALLHTINEGLIRSLECFERVRGLIKRL